MLKMIITDAVVSKGYEGAPAVRYYDVEGGGQIANFRIGKRVYDNKAEDNHRWINFTVKAFGSVCERIKRMKIKEGSSINLMARYDEETWTDKNTKEQKTAAILILDDIEYSSSGNGQKNNQNAAQNGGETAASQGSQQNAPAAQEPAAPQGQTPPPMPENFTGFEGFTGGTNPFF